MAAKGLAGYMTAKGLAGYLHSPGIFSVGHVSIHGRP
jgi:hypothetical protein